MITLQRTLTAVAGLRARFAAIAPQTGDQTNVKPWLIVAGVALVALVGITVWSSMHNKK